jgi:hypothetical protein
MRRRSCPAKCQGSWLAPSALEHPISANHIVVYMELPTKPNGSWNAFSDETLIELQAVVDARDDCGFYPGLSSRNAGSMEYD